MSRMKDFIDIIGKQMSVIEPVNFEMNKEIETNKQKLKAIVSTILFCGTHGIPLQEKKSDSSVIYDLFNFHVESGNEIMKNHFFNELFIKAKICSK